MHPSVAPLASIYALNTRLVHRCVDAMSPEQVRDRPAPDVNSAAFLVVHLTDSRFYIAAALLGAAAENPVAAYTAEARSLAEMPALPGAGELLAAWDRVSSLLLERLAAATAAQLAAPAPARYPGSDGTLLGGLAFLAQHDSYHVGQLAFIRRLYGLPAMRYG